MSFPGVRLRGYDERMAHELLPEVPAGFVVPDFSAPLDVEAHIASIPESATVKGQVNSAIVEALAERSSSPLTSLKFAPFKSYPMRDHVRLIVDVARALHPDLPLREAIRRVGQRQFPAFVATQMGKLIYGVFGGSLKSIFQLANRSFEMVQNTGTVTTTVIGKQCVSLRFDNTYTFLDCNHYGVIEGTLTACKLRGTVHARFDSPSSGEFFIRWAPRG